MSYVFRLINIALLLVVMFASSCGDDYDGSMAGCDGTDARNIDSRWLR